MIRAAARNAAARILSTFFGFGACVLEINRWWLDESYESLYHMPNKRGGRFYVLWKIDDAITNKGGLITCKLCLIFIYPFDPFRSTYLWALSSSSLNNDGFASNWCSGTNVLSSSDHLDVKKVSEIGDVNAIFGLSCAARYRSISTLSSHTIPPRREKRVGSCIRPSLISTFSFYVHHIIPSNIIYTPCLFIIHQIFYLHMEGYTKE